MKNQKKQFTLLVLLSLAFAACVQKEPTENNAPLTPPADIPEPYITAAEDARQKSILLIPYTENGLWGFADTTGTIRIEPIYKWVEPFEGSNLTPVKDVSGCFGLMDKTGKIVEPLIHDGIYATGNDVFGFGKEGYILLKNRDNRRIDHGQVINVFEYGQDGLNAVRTENGIGFMDTEGNMVTDDGYHHIYSFRHGVACVARGILEWHVIDKAGRQVSDFTFDQIYPFTHGYGIGCLAGDDPESHWGVIDTLGNVIIPFRYGHIMGSFADEYIACPTYSFDEMYDNKKYHYEILNKQGKKIAETRLDIGDNFTEGLAVVSKGEKKGYVDSLGRVVIPIVYDWTCGFRNGLAWVKKNGRYGFIDKQNRVVIPIQYENAHEYVFMEAEGTMVVDPKTEKPFYIDKTGREYRDFSR